MVDRQPDVGFPCTVYRDYVSYLCSLYSLHSRHGRNLGFRGHVRFVTWTSQLRQFNAFYHLIKLEYGIIEYYSPSILAYYLAIKPHYLCQCKGYKPRPEFLIHLRQWALYFECALY